MYGDFGCMFFWIFSLDVFGLFFLGVLGCRLLCLLSRIFIFHLGVVCLVLGFFLGLGLGCG
jgi:hypothetical protein